MKIPGIQKRVKQPSNKELQTQIEKLNHSLRLTIALSDLESTSSPNPYDNYDDSVAELSNKYEGIADWGIQQARSIIDVRSAFIIGQGIKVIAESKATREKEFIEEFIKRNNLDEEMPQQLAKEAEIEGKCLVKLIPNKKDKQVDLRFISWNTNKYKVKCAPDDYAKYESVQYKPGNKDDRDMITLTPEQFVYKKFAGRIDKVNEVIPKVGMVLSNIEALDKALKDWRKINHLFGSPTPYFECKDEQAVTKTLELLSGTLPSGFNWKIGKALASTAKFSLVGPDGQGIDSIEKEIVTNSKIISGATGIPVHFLGLPELMSNRSTSNDMFEMIIASTNSERHTWEGFWEEVFAKALVMGSELQQANFKEEVSAQILMMTESALKQLVEVWMPLMFANVVDKQYVQSKIPDADPEEINKRIEDENDRLLVGIKQNEKDLEEDEDGEA